MNIKPNGLIIWKDIESLIDERAVSAAYGTNHAQTVVVMLEVRQRVVPASIGIFTSMETYLASAPL